MKIIARGKQSGKTTELVKESARTGRYILVFSNSHAKIISSIAKNLGLNIPYPVTVDEIRNVGKCSSIVRDGLLVDEAIMVLRALIGFEIAGVTIPIEEEAK